MGERGALRGMIKHASGIKRASARRFHLDREFDSDPLNGAMPYHSLAHCRVVPICQRVMKLAMRDYTSSATLRWSGVYRELERSDARSRDPIIVDVQFLEEIVRSRNLSEEKTSFPNHLAFFLSLASPLRLCRVTCTRSLQKRPIMRKAALGNNNPAMIPRT